MNEYSLQETGWTVFFSVLRRVIALLAKAPTPKEGLELGLSEMAAKLGYKRVYLSSSGIPYLGARVSLTHGSRGGFDFLQGPGPTVSSQVSFSKRPLVLESIHDFQDFIGRPADELENFSFICVPILGPAERPQDQQTPVSELETMSVIGLLSVDLPKAPLVFLDTHRGFLEVVADIVANFRPKSAQPDPSAKPLSRPIGLKAASEQNELSEPVAVSKSMKLVLRQLAQAAQSDDPVLIRGENGTGKEFLAATLHASSHRASKGFFKFSCAGQTPEQTLAALFGVQKGERTKATQSRRGVLELANSGTLFIDDIDELEPEAQSALLRALQEGQVTRIGGDKPSKIDLRLIAACCEPLDSLVARGAFFEDLYYALNVFPVYVPPLRDRQADILPLAELFLRQASEKQDKTVKRISTPAIDLLNQYHWPGNLSELANCIERAVENCDEGVIRAYHLPPTLQSADSSDTGFSLSFGESVAKFEQELLVEALKKASGNMFKAARELRESYRVVNYKVKKYGLIPKRFLGGK